MAVYIEEEEVWKCVKHPSKRRKSGICPTCLRDRLIILCPNCANVRPCPCFNSAASASSSSSSSAASTASSSANGDGSLGGIGKLSNLIDGEPSFRRSRSVAIPFLRSRSRFAGAGGNFPPRKESAGKTPSFLKLFKSSKTKRREESSKENSNDINIIAESDNININNNEDNYCENDCGSNERIEEFASMMMRSRSVSVGVTSGVRGAYVGKGETRGGGGGGRWHFPSPLKAFRQSSSKTPKVVVQERSPLYRG